VNTHGPRSTRGKDLQDFQDLPRAPELNFFRKHRLPRAARAPGARAREAFETLNLFTSADGWRWIAEYFRHRFGRKHPFLAYGSDDNGIYPLRGDDGADDDAIRIAIGGDWATGTDEAFAIAELMAKRKPHYSIHLGDVYFVGDPAETKENFLGERNPRHSYTPCIWPKGSKGAFALSGNHEMYARGYAYFDLMLPTLGLILEGKAQGQKASFFCLENKYWRIIGLDTGYNSVGFPLLEYIFSPDCALPAQIIDWLRNVLRQKEDRRGIVLLSHHQYYSRFDDWYVKPAEQLAEFIDRPVLWLWGHEHRLTVHKKRQTGAGVVAYGRCVGHGGMPVELPPDQPKHAECEAEFVDRRLYHNDEHLKVGVNGFAALAFKGKALVIDYVDIEDKIIFSESWTIGDQGELARVS